MSRDGDHGHGVPDERRRAWGEKYEPRYSGVATFMRRPLRGDPEAWNGVDIGDSVSAGGDGGAAGLGLRPANDRRARRQAATHRRPANRPGRTGLSQIVRGRRHGSTTTLAAIRRRLGVANEDGASRQALMTSPRHRRQGGRRVLGQATDSIATTVWKRSSGRGVVSTRGRAPRRA